MKFSIISSIALVSILTVSSVAFAQGRSSASAGAQSSNSTAGTQSRIHTPGTGLTTDVTPLKTRIQTSITGPGVAEPGAGQAGSSNGGRGIHTPGTGLTTTTPVPVPTPVSN